MSETEATGDSGRSHRISADGSTDKINLATEPLSRPSHQGAERKLRRAGQAEASCADTQTQKLEAFGPLLHFIPLAVTHAHQNLKSNLAFVNSVNGVLLGQFTGKWTEILNWISALAIRDPFSRTLSPLSAADRSLCEH